MRLDLATIAFVGAWAFNVHATPVYTTSHWEVPEPLDTASVQAALSTDSIQPQAIEVEELLSTVTPRTDESLGPDVSFDTSLSVGGFDQPGETASTAHEVDLPPNDSHYYLLALVPLGFVGFTILKGWWAWKKQRTLDLHASRRVRTFREKPQA